MSHVVHVIALLAMTASPTLGQWTVHYLHPAGATESHATGVGGGQVVGVVRLGTSNHASLWTGSSWSWVDLHPAGAAWSEAWGVSDGAQVGFASLGGKQRAGLWGGTAASFQDLTPVGSTVAGAMAAHAGRQAGFVGYQFVGARAGFWNGSAATWEFLDHPAAATNSFALALDDTHIVGEAYVGGVPRASLWSGTSAWVDLTPAGATESSAGAVHEGQQVGFAALGGAGSLYWRASLWSGSAASWVDLHPPGWPLPPDGMSAALGVHAGRQVGYVGHGGADALAVLWSGTAESSEDLSLALAGTWKQSWASAIWSDSTTIYVAGAGVTGTGQLQALLWTRPIAGCYPDCEVDGDLDIFDFLCFQGEYANQSSYADCEKDGDWDIFDFLCFQGQFANGCD